MRPAPVLFVLALGCAPPPEVLLSTPTISDDTIAIELLYPEPGQIIQLDEDCTLHEPIVVFVTGVELTEPTAIAIENQAHWHGGPNLDQGFCRSFDNSCDDYEGGDLSSGPLNLFVSLRDNVHDALGAEDQVEIELIDPDSGPCP